MGNYTERRAMLMNRTHYRIHYLLSFRPTGTNTNERHKLHRADREKFRGARDPKLIFSVPPLCLRAHGEGISNIRLWAVRRLDIVDTCLLISPFFKRFQNNPLPGNQSGFFVLHNRTSTLHAFLTK